MKKQMNWIVALLILGFIIVMWELTIMVTKNTVISKKVQVVQLHTRIRDLESVIELKEVIIKKLQRDNAALYEQVLQQEGATHEKYNQHID